MKQLNRRRFLQGSSAMGALGLTGCLHTQEPKLSNTEFPPALLLTWQRDPTSTMTIDWHTDQARDSYRVIEYRERDSESDWIEETSEIQSLEIYDRTIHRTELTELEPDTEYEFRFREGPIYYFRTMPASLDEPVVFAMGGDTDGQPVEGGMLDMVVEHPGEMLWVDNSWSRVAKRILEYDPYFIAITGDLAYANGGSEPTHRTRWYNWLDVVKTRLIDDDNRVLPIIAGIGNHECRDGYYHNAERDYANTDEWREWYAPYFYGLFSFPGHPGYGVLDFGDYLSLIVLDTNHTNPIEGDQAAWLKNVLENRGDVSHIIPTYHVPAWPTYKEKNLDFHQLSRDHWIPHFEENGVRVAFEHHEHVYKRTKPIKNGEVDWHDGIVYVGDGALGQIRNYNLEEWYTEDVFSSYNFHIVTLDQGSILVDTIDDKGDKIDRVEIDKDSQLS